MTLPSPAAILSALALSCGVGTLAHAQPIDRAGATVLAQAQPNEQDKGKHKEEKKGPPPAERKGPPPGPPAKAMVPPMGPGAPPHAGPPPGRSVTVPPDQGGPSLPPGPPAKAMVPPTGPGAPPHAGPPPGKSVTIPPDKGLAPTQKIPPSAQPLPSSLPPGGKSIEPPVRKATEQPFEKKVPDGVKPPGGARELPKQVMPAQPAPHPGAAVPPLPKGPATALKPMPTGPAPRLEEVQKARKEHVEADGRRVIEEPGNRVIVKLGDRVVIRHDETDRFRLGGRDVRSERRPDGYTEAFYVRPDGMRIISVTDTNGRLLRRYRRGSDGREFNIIDNRRFYGAAVAVGVGAIGLAVALNLAQPRITIPRELYIVDYERASDDDLYEALSAPPVEALERAYSLEEVRENYLLRDRMRRIDLDGITFEFGAFEVTPDQYPKLERIARVMLRVLSRNPDEVFLVEGHTDAVGNDVDNLSLSDRRAEAVAGILAETFGVPPENLVTQGYGKQFLKIDTPAPERLNRRVAIRRITPLMSER